ncbi:helix-turn-helix domain-containing protein [Phenylobacterium sp.]|uniref:helix-turn-helix domain-containing protein n=1 Tax=Phenylobacterium sp. TaxID=1871053 RepID=UPI00272F16AD|nr:helix-turn-helix domain-containing protein [Phenylobacterium sp.]MDP1875303.1 helix-turn-helix domain-containing protein [Phenylobacterium sp.]
MRSLTNQKLRGGAERLADYLITQRVRQGGAETFTLPHEKRLLASLLGMTPENLSRAFATLTGYGVVINGPEVTIARPVVLERLAKPDPLIDNHHPPASRLWARPSGKCGPPAARASRRTGPGCECPRPVRGPAHGRWPCPFGAVSDASGERLNVGFPHGRQLPVLAQTSRPYSPSPSSRARHRAARFVSSSLRRRSE